MRAWLSLALLAPMPVVLARPATAAAQPVNAVAMAARVKTEFLHAWDSYKRYAWGHDELHPLSKKPYDWYGQSLLMTPVDALDTLVIMGLTKQADENRALIDSKLDSD